MPSCVTCPFSFSCVFPVAVCLPLSVKVFSSVHTPLVTWPPPSSPSSPAPHLIVSVCVHCQSLLSLLSLCAHCFCPCHVVLEFLLTPVSLWYVFFVSSALPKIELNFDLCFAFFFAPHSKWSENLEKYHILV